MIRRLICRVFGHRVEETRARRGQVRLLVTGCTRCDQILGIADTSRLPRMTVPRN